MPDTSEDTAPISGASEYRLRKPCVHCPFRSDIQPYLRPGRAREIADGLLADGSFTCHETTVPDGDEDGGMVPGPKAQACAGSLILMERTTGQPGQMARIAERLGLRDDRLDAADPAHPVYPDLTAWVRAHDPDGVPTVTTDDGDVLEYEHCGTVAGGCEDPAGFMAAGGAMGNPDPPTCNPLTDECTACGTVSCTACRVPDPDSSGRYLCVYCAEDDQD